MINSTQQPSPPSVDLKPTAYNKWLSPTPAPKWLKWADLAAALLLVILFLAKSCGQTTSQSYVLPSREGLSLSNSYYALPTPLRAIADNGGTNIRLDHTWPQRNQWLLPSGLVLAYTETSEEYEPVAAARDTDVLAADISDAGRKCMAGRFILIDPESGLIKQFTNTQLSSTIDASIVPLSDREVLVVGRAPRWDQCYTGLPPTADFANADQSLGRWEVHRYNYLTDTATRVGFSSNLSAQGRRFDYIPSLTGGAASSPFVADLGRRGVLVATEYLDGDERKPIQYVYSKSTDKMRMLSTPLDVPASQLGTKTLKVPGGKTLIYRSDGSARLSSLSHATLKLTQLGKLSPSISPDGQWYPLNPSQILIIDTALGNRDGGLETADRVMIYDLKHRQLYYRNAGLSDFASRYQMVPVAGNKAVVAAYEYSQLPEVAAVLDLATWQFERLQSSETGFAMADLPAYNLDLGATNIGRPISLGLNNWLFASLPQQGSGRNLAPVQEITTFVFYRHSSPSLEGTVNLDALTENGWRLSEN